MTDRVTLGITSCNRGLYTRALIKSVQCLRDLVDITVVDAGSTEEGLQEFLKESEGSLIDRSVCRSPESRSWTNDEFIAKNIIIEGSKNDIIVFVQDDCQFIGNPTIFETLIRIMSDQICVPCLDVMGVRRSTLDNQVSDSFKTEDGIPIWNIKNNHFPTTGIFDADIFKLYGPYETEWETSKENWGRAENEYDSRLKSSLQGCSLLARSHVPLFISIWNDPRGGYSFIRDNKRWGFYIPPVDESGLYYSQLTVDDYSTLLNSPHPASFDDVARPLGWTYPKNSLGEHIKYGQDRFMKEGPYSSL